MPDSFANYMKKEVVRYIKGGLDKGYSISQIRNALLHGGHHRDLIEEAIEALRASDFNVVKASAEPVKSKTLAQELYAEVLASLVDYIEFQQRQGYSVQEIKRVLLQHGHSEEILDSAIKAVKTGSNPEAKFTGVKLIISLFILILFILWVGSSTGAEFSRVLVGFFPVLASVTVMGIMANKLRYKQQVFLWLVPFIFAGAFFVLGQSGTYDIFEGMKIMNLAVLNIIMSLIFAMVLLNPGGVEQPEPMSDLVKVEYHKEDKKEEETGEKKPHLRPRIKEIRPA